MTKQSHEFMSVEGLVAGGGVLTQVIGWWQEGIGWVAGGGRAVSTIIHHSHLYFIYEVIMRYI